MPRSRRKSSGEREPINLMISNNQYDGNTFRSNNLIKKQKQDNENYSPVAQPEVASKYRQKRQNASMGVQGLN